MCNIHVIFLRNEILCTCMQCCRSYCYTTTVYYLSDTAKLQKTRPHPLATPIPRGNMSVHGFRSKFIFPDLSRVNWYPGHMAKGLKETVRRLDQCDCVIEVHDSRVSTHNCIFIIVRSRGRRGVSICYST